MNATRLSIACLSTSLLLGLVIAQQSQPTQPSSPQAQPADQPTPPAQPEQPPDSALPKKKGKTLGLPPGSETIAKPISEREKKKRAERLKGELETPYRKWLNEDVAYIITDEERAAFKQLQSDDQREQFIENFWLRRDPTPDTIENEFKEEHYRRIAYANDNYASGIPGWKTDRGRIYITYGPPDEIEDHSSGGFYERPPEEGGGETSTYPFQQWRYRYIEGVGSNIIIEFVDPTMSGEFHMTMDPSEKDALLYVPGAGLTMMEQLGLSDKTARFNNTDGTHLGQAFGGTPESMNEFTRLETFAKLQGAPQVKFKDLEAEITSKISYNVLPMKVRLDYFPVTDATVMTHVTVPFSNKDLQFISKEGMQRATVNIYGRISTLTRRVVSTFEETLTVDSPKEFLDQYARQKRIYQKTLPLIPGTYRLNIVAKDTTAGNVANYETAITVPRLDPDKASTSSIILADLMSRVPMKDIGNGMFVIGDTKVRPRMDDTFKHDEKMGIYLKVYNLGQDQNTHKPAGQVQYELVRSGSNEKLFDFSEDFSQVQDASSQQMTIEKLLPLATLQPGQYTLRLRITDKNRNQVLTPSAQFTVN
ncbi:MAG: GWxTD domain-containing protein [Bryobacteraceae bacterium]